MNYFSLGYADVLRTYQRTKGGDSTNAVYLAENEKFDLKYSQEKLNSILGIDHATFTRSVVMGQNIVTNFLAGSQQQRRTIIEDMLGLQKFDLYFECAKQKRQDIEIQVCYEAERSLYNID